MKLIVLMNVRKIFALLVFQQSALCYFGDPRNNLNHLLQVLELKVFVMMTLIFFVF